MVITEPQTFLTEEEAGQYLKITAKQLEAERGRGRIKPLRIVGGRIRYTYEILNHYVLNHPLNHKENSEPLAAE